MKILPKNLVIFCGLVLFCGQAVAQSNSPKTFCRYTHEMKYNEDGTHIYLNKNKDYNVLSQRFFPWGVCFFIPGFLDIEGASETSSLEDEWTKDAIQKWNISYTNYKVNRWESTDVVGIPEGPLFVKSCDRDKYNIIYTVKNDIGSYTEDTWGRYWNVDSFWDFRTFYAVIEMDNEHFFNSGKPRVWNRAHFVNVMMHELGHALGLPHMKGENSKIMTSNGFGGQCKDQEDKRLCNFTDYDFYRFLKPYNPAGAETRADFEARMKRERYYQSAEYRCRQPRSTILCP